MLLHASVSLGRHSHRKLAALGARSISTSVSQNDSAIGFIGLGQMGFHMAKHLQRQSDVPFCVYDMNTDAMSQFQAACSTSTRPNIDLASSPADLASKSSVIVTVLPESAHVKDVYTGSSGILEGIRKETLCIDSSTIDTSVSVNVSKQVIAAGARAVDAPISGGIMGAQAGSLTFMVGSQNAEDFEQAKLHLSKMGKNVVRCGDLGAGQAAKICNNLLLAISMVGTAEAMNLGIRLGLDPAVLASIINTSSGRCWSSDTANPVPGVIATAPSSKDYGGGFKTRLMLKDLGLVANAAKDTKSPLLLGSLAENIYRHIAGNQTMADQDFSVVYQWLARRSDKS
ncbi:3-hydroxyisobutyrate dehydrogenase-like protein mitochondrial precursor [Coemansia reversa NRRL 1564]|uniref:3-hydroxyisobutyrate dehydrogenase n=1 Tax=Coemansia reversa (strain ATCC 12441 / NRRL 1564) TaxID=763665 RepID=A0A2G5BE78_COERN|nr:3-hydroxyisobutyrate dehydrogenase-like protein mitochondrial precursor [Coemansia reversa NRRL 1564]|eukprot:PIA17326.1 3-hydroxyisobutyrate dehydrogenase-like protein mitochondrial precursor [Coemansia reversa NRRL 1564]